MHGHKKTLMAPWLDELHQSIPALAVSPHLRVLTIKSIPVPFDEARNLERIAWQLSMGRLKLYVGFIQELLASGPCSAEELETRCRSADSAQNHLSHINQQRNALMARIHGMKFACPEVPETTESYRSCPKCRGTDLQAVEKQTRSADEAGTVFYSCNNAKCGHTFR